MAKNLMIQGTMSNAGKSILTAGILRVLKQDGYRVAPFKSQNMALNSYITREGLEMGRAQVMQAEAAGIEPNVWMNPILLKPNSDMGSQVIVNGEVFGNREARDYFRMKKSLIPSIMKAYGELDSRYDIIALRLLWTRQYFWWEILTGAVCLPSCWEPSGFWRKKNGPG